MSGSVRPRRRQPTRLPRPWDSPGKNTGVGCHFLLQCMKVKSESEVAQSCLILSDPMDCSPPGSSVNGIFQASVLEWVTVALSEIKLKTHFLSCDWHISSVWQSQGACATELGIMDTEHVHHLSSMVSAAPDCFWLWPLRYSWIRAYELLPQMIKS